MMYRVYPALLFHDALPRSFACLLLPLPMMSLGLPSLPGVWSHRPTISWGSRRSPGAFHGSLEHDGFVGRHSLECLLPVHSDVLFRTIQRTRSHVFAPSTPKKSSQ